MVRQDTNVNQDSCHTRYFRKKLASGSAAIQVTNETSTFNFAPALHLQKIMLDLMKGKATGLIKGILSAL